MDKHPHDKFFKALFSNLGIAKDQELLEAREQRGEKRLERKAIKGFLINGVRIDLIAKSLDISESYISEIKDSFPEN